MKHVFFSLLILLCLFLPVAATDVTISAGSVSNANIPGLAPATTGTATVTNGSTVITSSAAFPARLNNLSGYQIKLGSITYYVSRQESTSSITLTTAYAGASGSVAFTIYPVVVLRFFATQEFVPKGSSEIIQSGAPTSTSSQNPFYKGVACSVLNNQILTPQFTLPATSDIENPAQQGARWQAYFFSVEGARLRAYGCFEEFTLAASPTTQNWTDICRYQNSLARATVDYSTLTREQIYAALQNRGTISGTYRRLGLINSTGVGVENSSLYQDGSGNVIAENAFAVGGGVTAGGDIQTSGNLRGAVPEYTVEQLADGTTYPCNATRVRWTALARNGNLAPRRCREVNPGVYRWVPDDTDYRPERHGDVATDAAAAIQAAHDAAYAEYAATGATGRVLLSDKVYPVSTGISIKSGVLIQGNGVSTKIRALTGFTDTAILKLTGTSGNYYLQAGVSGVALEQTDAGETALINAGVDYTTNSRFTDLTVYTTQGLLFVEYTQGCVIDKPVSSGYVDQLMVLSGNYNIVRDLDKINYTSSGNTNPYVLLTNANDQGACEGNVLLNFKIEGFTDTGKPALKLHGAKNTIIESTWYETATPAANGIIIENSPGTQFRGFINWVANGSQIQAINSGVVKVESFDLSIYDQSANAYFEADATSWFEIDQLHTKRSQGQQLIDSRVVINKHIPRQILTSPVTGLSPVSRALDLAGKNLLINPGFEMGGFGWLTSGMTFSTEASEVGAGLQASVTYPASPATYNLLQAVTIPSALVGRQLTFTAKVKASGTMTAASVYMEGAGVGVSNNYYQLDVGAGWTLASVSYTPQAAGTLYVGFYLFGATTGHELNIDDCSLAVGSVGTSDTFGGQSLTLGPNSNSQTYLSAAPVAGTWKQGDVVWNTTPAALGAVGWICTTAGSPGTWTPLYLTNKGLNGAGSLDFAQASANTCETLTVSVAGAADGDPVHLGVPHALANHNTTATFHGWRSASNTVSVRRCVISADGSDPAAATVKVTITQQ